MKTRLPMALTGLWLAAMAVAAYSGETVNARLAELDADGDKRVSPAEAAKDEALAKQFEKLDLNADGYLELVELVQYEALN